MSRFGTCKHAYQLQRVFEVSNTGLRRVIDTSDLMTCQWLETISQLPPPLLRQHGGFHIWSEDCDACPCYEPLASPPISKGPPRD